MIRISINETIEALLQELKEDYPALEYSEILKLGLSELHNQQKEKRIRREIERRQIWAQSLPTLKISEKEAESIAQGRREINDGEYNILDIDELTTETIAD